MNAEDDVMAIRKLIDHWSAAVRRRDYDGALWKTARPTS